MSRIQQTFATLKQQGKKALIPYITAGDPHPRLTVDLMHELVRTGADIIELGVPFSDPMADGPVIQRASERALAHHVSLNHVLEMVQAFRVKNTTTPVVLMGYANPVAAMGTERFADRAKAAGLDGVLTVDYPPEGCGEPARVQTIVDMASGFVYYVSLRGVTGAQNLDIVDVAKHIAIIREKTGLPIGVGFGVRDAATAKSIAHVADAVVVGSRMVQAIEQSNEQNVVANVAALMTELRSAINTN